MKNCGFSMPFSSPEATYLYQNDKKNLLHSNEVPFHPLPCVLFRASAEEKTSNLKVFPKKRRFRHNFKSENGIQLANENMFVVKCFTKSAVGKEVLKGNPQPSCYEFRFQGQ